MMKTKLKFFLVLLAMVVGGVNGVWAQNETYNFQSYCQQSAEIEMGDEYVGITRGLKTADVKVNGTTILSNSPNNDTNFPIRFAFRHNLDNHDNQIGWWLNDRNNIGLRCTATTSELAIRSCWNGDKVKIYYISNHKMKIKEPNSAKINGSFVTENQEFDSGTEITAVKPEGDGYANDIIITVDVGTGDNYTWITKIEFYYQNGGPSTTNVQFINPPSIMYVGDEFNTNNSGISITPSTATPVFSSSNTNVVTVDEYGYVKAVGSGTATISANLQIGPEQGNQYASSSSDQFTVTVPYSDAYARYNYDPAIEIYDLSGQASSTAYSTSNAGFNLNGNDAVYLTNLSTGLSLNNRVAVNKSSSGNTDHWFFDNGLKDQWSDHNVSICNLKEGDRVRITYEGTAVFSSAGTSATYNGCSAYKDFANNGYFDEADDQYIAGGTAVVNNTFYTITEDGHLDIGFANGSKITKIEIIGDHQAIMLDKYNGTASSGYTAYFSSTGQLMAKEHKVPGGLEVHIGNTDDSQHAIVVSSDEGPVSFVYDQAGFKMARQLYNSTTVTDRAPATGTFYRFIPEVNGTMTVRFKARSIRYNDYDGNGKDDNNEIEVTGVQSPYYLMVQEGNTFKQYVHPNNNTENAHRNYSGHTGSFNDIYVTAGNAYYVYGWWNDGTTLDNFRESDHYCGVAELIDVTFIPAHSISRQAKWVANATYDSSTETYYDNDLADVFGVTTSELHIKKKSSNITSCTAYIDGGKLKINNITFADATKGGGTILIKLGNGEDDPVFAYTIAYKASYNSGEGHKWNFSDNSLKGLKWTNTSAEAEGIPFGTANDNGEDGDGSSLLYDQMHPASGTSDWTFAYRVKIGDGGNDPMYLNKNPMSGNNANIIWDTEGLIINAGSNQSCINNEYTENGGVINHSDKTNRHDPDRYVGILPGGEFIIPGLTAGDRVLIYMGSGDGSGNEAIYMNVTNAKDAIGTVISGEYHIGGSLWQASSDKITQRHGDPNYRGAYHFIAAADGDMVFTLEDKGTLAKLYSIEIYSGKHRHTNDLERAVETYNNENYNLNGYQYFSRYNTSVAPKGCYTMHYRGKGEGLSEPLVVHHTGNAAYDPTHLFHGTIGTNHFIFYKSEKNQFGLIRMRVDVKDLNGTYATDYGLQNIVVGCLDKMTYPYTWDFTDLMKYAYTDDNNKRIKKALSSASGYTEATEFMDNAIVEWKSYDDDIDAYDGYGLHIQNSDFSGEMVFPGQSQLYAGDQIIAETQGLDFIQMSTQQKRNGRLRITGQGLYLDEQNVTGGHDYWRIMIPEVPANAAVYIRAKQISPGSTSAEVEYLNGNNEIATKSFDYSGTAANGDYIYATKQGSTSGDMTFRFQDVVLQKIAVSTDAKQFNAKGWTTESRAHDIDPYLTAYMTGHNIKTYLVTDVVYANKTVELTEIGSNTTESYLMHMSSANDDQYACILRNDADEQLNIVNSSFHLFVPDMHDEQGSATAKNYYTTKPSKMKSVLSAGTIEAQSGDYWNYGLGYQYYDIDPNTGKMVSGSPLHTGAVAFYRIEYEGASSAANKGYLPVLMSAGGGAARFSIVFADGDENQSVGIVANETESTGNGNYYNLNGQRLNGEPSRHGLYIVNGKKMYVK